MVFVQTGGVLVCLFAVARLVLAGLAAAFGPVGLSEDGCDFVTRGNGSLQGRDGEIGRAEEN